MLHEELLKLAEPVLAEVVEHPFWAGLRDGSLPGDALTHFIHQDTGYLLPAYGRALARCAAIAPDDEHSAFFARSVSGAMAAKDRLRLAFAELAPSIDIELPREQLPIDPATHAHCSFFQAATVTSLPAAVGALLPMAWFNYTVSCDLAQRCVPNSRYAQWVKLYQPSEGYYEHVVRRYLDLVDAIGERCSADERRTLTEHWSISIRYEWMFAEAAWRQPTWPV